MHVVLDIKFEFAGESKGFEHCLQVFFNCVYSSESKRHVFKECVMCYFSVVFFNVRAISMQRHLKHFLIVSPRSNFSFLHWKNIYRKKKHDKAV